MQYFNIFGIKYTKSKLNSNHPNKPYEYKRVTVSVKEKETKSRGHNDITDYINNIINEQLHN